MRRKAAAALIALVAALACSACGSAKAVRQTPPPTTTVAKVPPISLQPEANLVVLSATHGAGNKNFGTFRPAGTVFLEYTCTGGRLTIVGFGGPRPCNYGGGSVAISSYEGRSMNLTLRAKPGTTWWFAAGEQILGAKLVHPHRTLVLVQRTGSGSKSLGTFRLGGAITVSTSCKGWGSFDVRLDPSSQNGLSGLGTVCPEGRQQFSSAVPKSRPFHIYVVAARRARWTVTVTKSVAVTSAGS
jgi:hypothetical protein